MSINKITTILTTHSPSLLTHFIHDDKDIETVIAQKEEDGENKGYLKKSLPYLWEIIDRIKQSIEKSYKKYARKSENLQDSLFYRSKWKRLFNEETLLPCANYFPLFKMNFC